MKPVVLLVDDEKSTRSALRRVFKKNNFDVLEAGSGQVALDVLESNIVDVVVSDQRMPYMNGTKLLSQVKQTYPNVGRIMLSGQSDYDDLCEAINEASIYRFLHKPWDEEQLVSAVKEVVPSGILNSDIKTSKGDALGDVTSSRNNKVMAAIIKDAVIRHQAD